MYTFLKINMQYLCWFKPYIFQILLYRTVPVHQYDSFSFSHHNWDSEMMCFFSWKLGNFGSNVMRFLGQRNFDTSYLPLWNPFKTKNQKQLFFITQFDKWMILKDVFLLIFQYLTFFIKLNDDRSKFPHRFFFAWKWQITSRMIHLHVCGKWLFSQGSGALFKGMVTVVKGLMQFWDLT